MQFIFLGPDVDLFSCAGYCGPGLPVLAGTAPRQPLLLRDGGRHRHLHPRRIHISHSGPLSLLILGTSDLDAQMSGIKI
jgi:hypothetical protein